MAVPWMRMGALTVVTDSLLLKNIIVRFPCVQSGRSDRSSRREFRIMQHGRDLRDGGNNLQDFDPRPGWLGHDQVLAARAITAPGSQCLSAERVGRRLEQIADVSPRPRLIRCVNTMMRGSAAVKWLRRSGGCLRRGRRMYLIEFCHWWRGKLGAGDERTGDLA